MRNHFLSLGFAVMALASVSAAGAVLNKEAIPPKVLAALLKDHPKAEDITAEVKKHFGQELYMVTFKELTAVKAPVADESEGEEAKPAAAPEPKETKEELIETYRKDGHFFVSADRVDHSNVMPAAAYDNLKKDFPSYTIEQAVMIPNPNGPGEEFDLTINAAGEKWVVTIDRKAEVALKEKQ